MNNREEFKQHLLEEQKEFYLSDIQMANPDLRATESPLATDQDLSLRQRLFKVT